MMKKNRTLKTVKKHYALYLMLVLPAVYFIIFKYVPMIGTLLAFRKYTVVCPFLGEKWMGLHYFKLFLSEPNFYNILKNTVILSIEVLCISFPIPIVFALLLNELRYNKFKKVVQTVSYLPHFISIVVVVGFASQILSPTNGILNMVRVKMGMETINYMAKPECFRPIYIITDIWQNMGWNAIMYIAALSGVDIQLYEAAKVDGARKFQQMLNITIPGIMPTIVITFILAVGNMLSIGYEKVLLLMNSLNRDTADVIGTYVYRRGIVDGSYSYSTAVSLFMSVISLFLITITNKISAKVTEESLW